MSEQLSGGNFKAGKQQQEENSEFGGQIEKGAARQFGEKRGVEGSRQNRQC